MRGIAIGVALAALCAANVFLVLTTAKLHAAASRFPAEASDAIEAGFNIGTTKRDAQELCRLGSSRDCKEAERIDRELACVKQHALDEDVVERCGVALYGPEPRP